MKIAKKAAVVATAAALLSIVGISQAEATSYKGSGCDAGSAGYPCLGLWYNSNETGSHAAFQGYGTLNLGGYTFASPGNGQGQPVKNNAASAFFWSRTVDETAAIYYNSNQGGPCDELWAQGSKTSSADRLRNTYNNDASIKIFDGSQPSGVCYQF